MIIFTLLISEVANSYCFWFCLFMCDCVSVVWVEVHVLICFLVYGCQYQCSQLPGKTSSPEWPIMCQVQCCTTELIFLL